MAVLEVDIAKRYPGFELEIAFECDHETLGILGASGCGKSQTLRAIAGIMTPDEGKIVLNGRTFFDSAAKINLPPRERNVSFLFQNYQLFPNMTVYDNVIAGMPKTFTKEQIQAEAASLIKFFKLDELEKKYPRKLSGGQQQRVALARMLGSNPEILMFDEPFSALDANLKSEIYPELLEMLSDFKGPKLYISHDIDEAFMFCDHMLVIDDGHIADSGTAERVVQKPRSLASMKLAGILNTSPVKKIDDHTIEVTDWRLKLTTEEIVPDDVKYVGIRDNALEIVSEHGTNVFLAEVIFENSGIYRREATLDLSVHDENLTQEEERKTHLSFSRSLHAPERMLARGERVYVHFPPERLHIVNR